MFLRFLVLILVACSFLGQARAEQRFIVRVVGGLPMIETLCRQLGCKVLTGIGDPLGQLVVVALEDSATIGLLSPLKQLSFLFKIEPDLPVSLLPASIARTAPLNLFDSRPVDLAGTTVWNGYAFQPPSMVVRAQESRSRFYLGGAGPVAVIDSGVDPNHPALRPVLLPGYDFTRNSVGGSEMADVNQSTTAVVDGGPATLSNNVIVANLNQSTTAVVDDPRNRGFGHGTMVAGIIHLVAPRAQILPMKAFAADGTGFTSDIIRAIYASVASNARVINMSFSMTSPSDELSTALTHAVTNGVICVSSAGNDGRKTSVYPASLDTVIGVGSTNLFDGKSSFSNYGNSLVWVAAPGEQIVSTYPYSTYASASGTSFSTPFVAGAAALMVESRPSVTHWTAAQAIGNAVVISGELGHGRLDIVAAVDALLRSTR